MHVKTRVHKVQFKIDSTTNVIQLHNSVGLNDIIVASADECSSFANRNCLSTVTNRRTTIATGTDCASVG